MHLNNLEKRLIELEQEVSTLKQEIAQLKNQVDPPVQIVEKAKIRRPEKESVQTKKEPLEKAPLQWEKTNETPLHESKQQKSIEEMLIWLLPKVFMIMIVLGVLWGLKLISDYGIIANGIKITFAYVLSLALIGLAYFMEYKKKSQKALYITLYGGAFTIGILTTAAGAILYDVLPLLVALFVAMLYIAYGIVISYMKKSEVLTIFVAFTSLLLPYLLEYMAFGEAIILAFVVILFGSLQIVILKHCQKIALYTALFFSHLAILIVGFINNYPEILFGSTFLIVLGIFMYSWWCFYEANHKRASLYEGLMFSLSIMSLLFINLIATRYNSLFLLVFTAGFIGLASFAYLKKQKRIVDIYGTVALLALMNFIVRLELSTISLDFFLPFTAFISLFLALRLRASLMKLTYSLLFGGVVLFVFIDSPVEPFWSFHHLNQLFMFAYMLVLFIFAKRPKVASGRFETLMEKAAILEIIPILISLYIFGYIAKLDISYMHVQSEMLYFTLFALAIATVSMLFVAEKYIGRFLPVAFLISFCYAMIFVLMVENLSEKVFTYNIFLRIVYAVVFTYLLYSVYKGKGYLKKWRDQLRNYVDPLISIGLFVNMISATTLLSQINMNNYFGERFLYTGHTIIIFITACIALWLSLQGKQKIIRYTGFSLLVFAIAKLIFFDLSYLDLLIRAILFISIGGLGLWLSNKLLQKAEEEE
ncbi:DUF2339 domain-containing protein [Viridibacillus sp. YIM B01967]|uniref:DUF2339 domain-containing protein n=1 Tax=Viridibacillus soli TaxID=2798301 RepID=A0ABS1HCV8_9BACL|nr:DUF2339 domain-containing protein [Viridibacillus soli]MBK3497216.1 DUF2339 domain-containing protein [Viridibacillus soli]